MILPCYNEAQHFTESISRIVGVLEKSNFSYEIILVEDKSRDCTPELIRKFIQTYPKPVIHVIWHTTNQGRGQAVIDGMRKAGGKIVGYIDIDCEISPEYIPQFVHTIEKGWDIACGWRTYQISPSKILRALTSKVYSWFVKRLLVTELPDTESGYKFFRSTSVASILPSIKNSGWFWDTEVMIRSENAGLKIKSIPVIFDRRSDKTSTVKLFEDTIEYIQNLWQLRKEMNSLSDSKDQEVDQYWYTHSAAFSHQYATFMGVPLTPVGVFLVQRYKLISRLLRTLPGDQFLDVGCGSGIFMRAALLQKKHAIGIDYSEQMIMQSAALLKSFPTHSYKLLKSDATKIPVKTSSIDLLLASGLTDYLKPEETKRFMQEVSRLTKKGGFAILTFPKSDSPFRFIRQGLGLALRKKFLKLPAMMTSYSKTDIESLLKTSKLSPIEWHEVLGTMRVVVAQKI